MITALRSVWQLSTGRARRQHQIPTDPSLPNRMPTISGPYRQQALVPPVGTAPEDAAAIDRVRPQLEEIGEQQYTVRSTKEQPWLWVVWTESNDQWKYQILPGQSDVPLKCERGKRVAVAGVNRWGYTTDAHYLETP